MENYMNYTFWERVIFISDEMQISRKALADEVNIDVSSISKGIAENRMPAVDTAYKIASYLGTTVEYLLTGQ